MSLGYSESDSYSLEQVDNYLIESAVGAQELSYDAIDLMLQSGGSDLPWAILAGSATALGVCTSIYLEEVREGLESGGEGISDMGDYE